MKGAPAHTENNSPKGGPKNMENFKVCNIGNGGFSDGVFGSVLGAKTLMGWGRRSGD